MNDEEEKWEQEDIIFLIYFGPYFIILFSISG